jgi:hypothetical protein
MRSIKNVINSASKNEDLDSQEELPSPEKTPIRMQQREFVDDFRPDNFGNISRIEKNEAFGGKNGADSDPDDTIIID